LRLGRSIAAALLAGAAVLTGCWGVREGPQPPDLNGQNSEVEQTIARLQRIEETMAEELQALREAQRSFFDEQRGAWAPPFPLDAFKHTAMSCLNAPVADDQAAPEVNETATKLGITCAVPAAQVLDAQLDEAHTVRAFGVTKIRQIDEVRTARAKIQGRLRQLPSIARRTRNYLASRRAELRQTEAETERRRADYLRKDYEETMRRLRGYRDRLDALDDAIGEVEQSIPRWSREVGDAVDALYKDLSRLGRA